MSHKFFTQVLVLVLILLAFFGTPLNAQAGGVCGGPYVVAAGDTLETIAAMCGTTVSAIYAANPGIGAQRTGWLRAIATRRTAAGRLSCLARNGRSLGFARPNARGLAQGKKVEPSAVAAKSIKA